MRPARSVVVCDPSRPWKTRLLVRFDPACKRKSRRRTTIRKLAHRTQGDSSAQHFDYTFEPKCVKTLIKCTTAIRSRRSVCVSIDFATQLLLAWIVSKRRIICLFMNVKYRVFRWKIRECISADRRWWNERDAALYRAIPLGEGFHDTMMENNLDTRATHNAGTDYTTMQDSWKSVAVYSAR